MIHIEDDFFEDPYSVRNTALKSYPYEPAEDGTWPGYRSWNVPENITNHILIKVRSFTGNQSLDFNTQNRGSPNISFQYMTKEFGDGAYHSDPLGYICIIYLSLDPPVDSGTEVCDYDHSPTPVVLDPIEKESFIKDPYNLIKRYRYAKIRRKINSYYKPILKVPNKFNRGIIFPSTNFHRAQNFFGTSIGDARLTMVAFLK